jgi:phage/conjugal plasmid C-4 type zinc finger TraR family protein
MADAMDLAQQREQEDRERHISNARSRIAAPSRFLCEECDIPIPEARRIAIPGVTFCVTCQEVTELKSKHYRGYELAVQFAYPWNAPRSAIASPYLTYDQQHRRDRMFAALLHARKVLSLQPECVRFDVYRTAAVLEQNQGSQRANAF